MVYVRVSRSLSVFVVLYGLLGSSWFVFMKLFGLGIDLYILLVDTCSIWLIFVVKQVSNKVWESIILVLTKSALFWIEWSTCVFVVKLITIFVLGSSLVSRSAFVMLFCMNLNWFLIGVRLVRLSA